MPNKLKSILNKKLSAKEIIEKTPDINKYEMLWVKRKAGDLTPAAVDRQETIVSRLWWIEGKKQVHTHIMKKKNLNPCWPSIGDIKNFLCNILSNDEKVEHIVSIEKGKVIGYTTMYAEEKFVEFLKSNEGKIEKEVTNMTNEMKEKLEKDGVKPEEVNFKHKLLNQLKNEEIKIVKKFFDKYKEKGLRIRFTPMPNYEWNEKELKFVKKSENKKQ